MTRPDFIAFLAQYAPRLHVPLHESGPLAGLPQEIERTLELVDTLRETGQPWPHPDEVRRWYASGISEHLGSTSREALNRLQQLREADLDSLDSGDLLLLATACGNWHRLAMAELRERQARRERLFHGPSSRAPPSSTGTGSPKSS